MKAITLAAFAAIIVSISGCATVTRGTKDVLEVETTPSGAQAMTTNGYSCASTPCAIKMPRRSEFDVDITKAGYKPARVHVTSKVSGAGGAGMAGNVLVGGIIGAGVDIGTGAMLDLVPNPVKVALEPLGATPAGATAVAAAPAQTVRAQAAPAQTVTPAPAATPVAGQAATPISATVAANSLPPLPTQTKKLPGHRLAAYGCPGFAPRVLYSESPEKLPKDCERIEHL